MILEEIQRLLDEYVAWLKDNTALRQIDDWVEITTPYLDRDNDCVQIYAKRDNGGYLLSDGGDVLQQLRLSGCNLDTPNRQALLKMTLSGFGVKLIDDVLEVRTSPHDFALRKHNLVQAMLSVNDLFYVAQPMVVSLFYEDVVSWLESYEIRYTRNVKFTGKSGYDHLFNFVIPKSRQYPERILQAISHPNRDAAQAAAFRWIDTREVREADSRAYALLNDIDRAVPESVIEALENYDVRGVPWSRRGDVVSELVA